MASYPYGFEWHIDRPQGAARAVTHSTAAPLRISGWVVGPEGVDAVTVTIDEGPPRTIDYGMPRPDVAAARPGLAGAGRSGFNHVVPAGALTAGPHSIVLRIVAGGMVHDLTTIDILDHTISRADLNRALPAAMPLPPGEAPFFICWIPALEAVPSDLARTIAGLALQAYPDWIAVLSCGPMAAEVRTLVPGPMRQRILVFDSQDDLAIETYHGRDLWVLRSEAGVELARDALARFAAHIAADQDCDFVYADERFIDPAHGLAQDFRRPGWSPELLASTNYIGATWCVAMDRFARVFGGLRDFDRRGAYDAILACSEQANRVTHVSVVLSQRDLPVADTSADLAALTAMVARRGMRAAAATGLARGSYRLRATVRQTGLVSIIVPTCCKGDWVTRCLSSLRAQTRGVAVEIICVENAPRTAVTAPVLGWLADACDRLIEVEAAFNWSRFNNIGAGVAAGDLLLFLNDDTEAIEPDWLEVLAGEAMRPEVGAAGPLLLYPDRTIQHAGLCMTAPGHFRHSFRGAPSDDPGYFGLALTQREVLGLTGACLMLRRSVYDAVGGFDERHSIINNDVDMGLRIRELGLRCVYTPFSRLLHHEGASRAGLGEHYDAQSFAADWAAELRAGDPFVNAALYDADDPYESAAAAKRRLAPGQLG